MRASLFSFYGRPGYPDRACRTLFGVLALTLAGCGSIRPTTVPAAGTEIPLRPAPKVSADKGTAPALPAAGSGRGGYYLDDGPGETPPADLLATPDAEPKVEPYSVRGNKPYVVFGKTYAPVTDNTPLKQRGIGSWYGKKFHGQKTSSGELYDMYKMTAAHPTLPIPSYARVTNLKNGAQIIVRVNDRGPFHSSRIIDLSYTAALKLGYLGHGSSELEVERLLPDEIARINSGTAAGSASAAVPSAINAPTIAASVATAAIANPPPSPPSVPAQTVSLEDFLKTQEGRDAQESMTPVSLASSVVPLSSMSSTPDAPYAYSRIASNGISVSPAAAVANPLLSNGFYLQFGAYSRSANAEALRARLMQSWPEPLPRPEVRQNGPFYRLYSGPFNSRNEALEAARLLPDAVPSRPLIVQR